MKLSRLYSNQPKVFLPILFHDGLNVVIGSIRHPKRNEKDTHNLGKTILAELIDFCLLRKKTPDFFLFKHACFQDFIFYLEIQTQSGLYVTIRRGVEDGSKASFLVRKDSSQDVSDLPEAGWSHWMVGFDKSKEILDGLLDLSVLRPWTFRKGIAYCLRSQNDFDEPFMLSKYGGSHAEWKPFLAHVLGLNGALVLRGYELDEQIAAKDIQEKNLRSEASGIENPDQLRGLVEILEREVATLTNEADRFDLAPADERATQELVDSIDDDIARLNEERYAISSEIARIEKALNVQLSIDLEKLKTLFAQAKIYFGDQIKRDYEALEQFNRELAAERDEYLRAERSNKQNRLVDIEKELASLNVKRIKALSVINDTVALSKYKALMSSLAAKQADLQAAQRRFTIIEQLTTVRHDLAKIRQERSAIHSQLEDMIAKAQGNYATIRRYFDEVVHCVIDRHANLFSKLNKQGHLEFQVEILDGQGGATSAGRGFSYRRLLCVALDMAMALTYANFAYPHFIYHDGIFESLDDRKKINLIEIIRRFSTRHIQHIITCIDSELPHLPDGSRFMFSAQEAILNLHDDGDDGRLFRMPPW